MATSWGRIRTALGSSSKASALVLDGQECHALAGVRSLGRHGVRVSVASPKTDAMSFYSRHCRERLTCPSPATDPDAFATWLLVLLEQRRFDAVLFFGEATANVVVRHRESIQALTGCPMPPLETFLTADRKDRVLDFARRIGVRTPATFRIDGTEPLDALAARLTFPIIVKGVNGSGGHQVALVHERAQFEATVQRFAASGSSAAPVWPVVQEFVPGSGYGLTALLRAGEPLAVFMHRRMVEHDVGRGTAFAHATPAAESVEMPELREAGLRLLRALHWDGVAMVEFRRSAQDGHFYLMEINPRFPGSLDLAIAAGIDLPWLYYRMAINRDVEAPTRYPIGLKYRWLLSKNVTLAFENPRSWCRSWVASLRLDTRTDVSWRDPGPHYSHLRSSAWWVRNHLAHQPVPPGSHDITAGTAGRAPQRQGTEQRHGSAQRHGAAQSQETSQARSQDATTDETSSIT
jgi:predicted ATP-grasp superfamily ATP-dependent carboligase